MMRTTLLLAALVLAGCATAPDLDTRRTPATPAAFKEAAAPAVSTPSVPAGGAWWKTFQDDQLAALIERADQDNTDIQQAGARVQQARALVRSADAARAPQVGAAAGVSRATQPASGNAPATLATLGADLSYEVDLFGRLARASSAAELDAQAREALLRGTRLLVQAEVAQTYLALRALDDERALVRRTVAAYRDTLRLTERREQVGDVAELDVARVRTEVAATESEALALDRQRAALLHALAVLVGTPASGFELAPSELGLERVAALPSIPAGVPSAVLARRPDVAAAQATLAAAQQRVGVAEKAWYPNLSLTAAGGAASPELGDLLKASARAWSVGALLALPLLDGGRRDAALQSAAAEREAAYAGYRDRLLVALRDVEDQLSALRLLGDQAAAQADAVASASRATALSGSRYRNGFVSQLELLDAQRSELRNRRQAVQVQGARYQATVGLIRALGGGWGG